MGDSIWDMSSLAYVVVGIWQYDVMINVVALWTNVPLVIDACTYFFNTCIQYILLWNHVDQQV